MKKIEKNRKEKSPEEQYRSLFERIVSLCNKYEWGDPMSYARSKEIYMASMLGHKIASTYSGADAIDKKGNEVEYKSTIGSVITATYNGISVFPTWRKQLNYLKKEKIGKYKWHYFARFEDGKIAECYKAPADKVLEKLVPKLRKAYKEISGKKDPRLGTSLSSSEIKEISKRVI